MPRTRPELIEALILWLNTNAYWNPDLEVRESATGLGVFLNLEGEEIDLDPLLLRIPKGSILSPKNSLIYNLLAEYEDGAIDLTSGMFGLIVSVIYEMASPKSPWKAYLDLIDLDNGNLPISLWDSETKAQFKNTELDLLNLFDENEVVGIYCECAKFAKSIGDLIPVPSVFNVDSTEPEYVLEKCRDKLELFGRYSQCVISRAFKVDQFHDLALVPGADLFNHKSPEVVDGKAVNRETVHFECDDEVCGICGEFECEHEDEDEDEWEDEEEEEGEEEEEEGEDEEGEEEMEEEQDDDDEMSEEDDNVSINLDYIYNMEQELHDEEMSDAETDPDIEEVSTLGEDIDGSQDDLAKELSDSSKCCDIVLVGLPDEKYNYELFNSYGNDLPNAFLLQKYGFIEDENINDTCLLAVQLCKYVKDVKKKLGKKAAQLDEKIKWYEEDGFDIVCQMVYFGRKQREKEEKEASGEKHDHDDHDHDDHDHDHEHDDHEDCDSHDGCNDSCCDDDDFEEYESWELSARIRFDGSVTEHTYAILNLVECDYKTFKAAIAADEEDMIAAVGELLLPKPEHYDVIKGWCSERLAGYKPTKNPIAAKVINQEKKILERFIDRK